MGYGRDTFAVLNAPLNERLETSQPAIVVHRGSPGGGIIENTTEAVVAAFRCGADLVEIDVVRSADGEYFVFHDGYESKWFGLDRRLEEMTAAQIEALRYPESQGHPVETLEGLMTRCADDFLVIDRSWRYWDSLLPRLDRFAKPERVLMKSTADDDALRALAEHSTPYPLLLIAFKPEEIEQVRANESLNLLGVELVFESADHPFADAGYVRDLHERGLFTHVNALDLGDGVPLAAGWDDTVSVVDSPARGWDELAKRGYSMIQTDWPLLLHNHLATARV